MSRTRLFLRYLNKYRLHYAAAISATIATNILVVTIPDYIKKSVEILSAGSGADFHALLVPVTAILVFSAVLLVVRSISRILFYNSSRAIECDIKNDMLAHLMRLGRDYYENNPPGVTISRINNDITGVRLLYGFGLLQVINLVSALSLVPYKMWLLSPSLTLGCTAAIFVVFVLLRAGMKILYRKVRRQADILRDLSGFVASILSAVDVIRNFGMRRWSQTEFRSRNRAWIRETVGITRLRSVLNPVLGNLEHLLKILVLGVGGLAVIRGHMTIGDITAFLVYIGILTAPLMGLSWLLNMTQQGLVGLASVSLVFGEKAAPGYLKQAPAANGSLFRRSLEVKALRYRYPGADEDALGDISFTLKPGETLGILGAVGSGKSTLVGCLNRYLEPEPGRIFLDGTDITALPYETLRRTLRTVTQEPFLFSDTVKGNVCFLPGAELSGEELGRLLASAALEDEIARFPHGIDTLVGEKGIMLSGGQKQRISLARALAAPCPVLVLDDVLSAVDYQTEQHLLGSIYSAPGVSGRIIVSHRVKALERADRILVLEKGRVVDQGTHGELAGRPGYYRETWELQNRLDHTSSGAVQIKPPREGDRV